MISANRQRPTMAAMMVAVGLAAGCPPAAERRDDRAPNQRVGAAIGAGDHAAQRQAARAAIDKLAAGDFAAAGAAAERLVAGDADNVYGRLVRAVTSYKRTMHDLVGGMKIIVVGVMGSAMLNRFFGDRSGVIGGLDSADRLARVVLEQARERLAAVEGDLAAAARAPDLHLELCLACWQVDWSGTGSITDFDRHLLEIEIDERGEDLPAGDPRRRPVFRFDHGDVIWAEAFVVFQRAVVDLLLAFRWTEGYLLGRGERRRAVIRLVDAPRVASARGHVLRGLDLADRARRAYLAETDDDREWLPSPRQKSHPLPLPVDEQLYRTWEGVIGDLQRLVRGEEGLGVAELAQLGDHRWPTPPRGYLDIGRMLAEPRDIVVDVGSALRLTRPEGVEQTLADVFGDRYVAQLKPSPLIGRLQRMKREMRSGKETFERKLRYLLWLN